MAIHEQSRTRHYIKYAIIALIVVLIGLSIIFIQEYVALRRAQTINAREAQLSHMLAHHGPLTANDVALIQPWMTFDYVNKLFNVPPDYLKNGLTITDNSYPQLSLSGYARYQKTDTATVLTDVENSLAAYLTSTSTAH